MSSNIPTERNIGFTGISLLIALKSLGSNTEKALKQVEEELTRLTQYPEPEMRRILKLTLSLLVDSDWQVLRQFESRISKFLLQGEEELTEAIA